MKILFYYPWDGFKKDFLHKDVGLLPSYLAGLNGSVRMLIKGNGVRDDFRNISYQYIGNSYLTGLINLLLEILTQKYNCFLIFHIGLKNLIPVFIMKLIGKKFIVCKCDLNIETAIYITTKHDKISDRIKVVLYKSMFKKIDCLIVETSSVFKILDEKKIDLCIKNLKLLPNGLDDNEFSNLIPIKDKNKKKIITIITRFESDKKAPERLYDIIENWSLPDDWSLHVIGQVPSNLGELIQNKCKK
ncbi:hypothetical protein, partial [Vibrio fluvialis]|uniref:hypothetical protein n=1 Tax=Vibrio fluvialis TaxID=676 RepID=UPI001F21BA0E